MTVGRLKWFRFGPRPPSSGTRSLIRVGAVSYLNTKPLIDGLRDRLRGWGTLTLNLPSRLADDLAAGRLDVALIPSIESFRDPRYRILSDAAIGCLGPVWSVRLLSRVPVDRIRTLALDEGSRTSAAMVQILLAERFGVRPALRPLPMETLPDTVDADAVLLIGDRAMHPPGGFRHDWDLGQHWVQHTGLPFVFAPWVLRSNHGLSDSMIDRLETVLAECRDCGVGRLDRIAADHAASHGFTADELETYFRRNLHFYLGEAQRTALDEFRRRAEALQLISTPQTSPLAGR